MDNIGELKIAVKPHLEIDEKTFNACMSIIAVHELNHGRKGMVIEFNEECRGNWNATQLESEEAVRAVMNLAYEKNLKKKRGKRNETT